LFEAVFNPSAYSVIADLFPPADRGTANSIFNMGIYFGGALSSLSALMILEFGW
jgi:MFS family permease